jgi:hypothetical protein
MQGIGCKEDTELNKEDLSLSWRELSVESVGHCQSLGKWRGFSRKGSRHARWTRHDTPLKTCNGGYPTDRALRRSSCRQGGCGVQRRRPSAPDQEPQHEHHLSQDGGLRVGIHLALILRQQ